MTSPIAFPGDGDPGGRDTVAAGLEQAMMNAAAARHALESGTFGQGSVIGNLLDLPPVPEQGSKHAGGDDAGYPA